MFVAIHHSTTVRIIFVVADTCSDFNPFRRDLPEQGFSLPHIEE